MSLADKENIKISEILPKEVLNDIKEALSDQNADINTSNGDIATSEQLDTDGKEVASASEAERIEDKKERSEYGKFKNPQELMRAYKELEKEFTRRSQRLAELESGATKQSEAYSDEGEWRIAVDKFFEQTPSARAFAKDIANEIISHPELKQDKNCLDAALTRVLLNKFRTPEQLMGDGEFLKNYVFASEQVRDAVISQYLDGLRRGQPPFVMTDGGVQCVAPKSKPKSIQEAGVMFLKNNK